MPPPTPINKRKHEEKPTSTTTPPPRPSAPKGGEKKTKSKKGGRVPNVPKELIGKALEGPSGQRICWPYNISFLDVGTPILVASAALTCTYAGCQKAHSLLQHSWQTTQPHQPLPSAIFPTVQGKRKGVEANSLFCAVCRGSLFDSCSPPNRYARLLWDRP